MNRPKQKTEIISESQHLINYLKSQIYFFSVRPNKSERIAGHYQNELNKLQND